MIPIHTMGFQNCDIAFDKIFADDIEHIKGFRNFNQFRNLAEVHSVIHGQVSARDSKSERILVYNIGIAIQDIYFASKVIKMLPSLRVVKLEGPPIKMWFPPLRRD